MEFKIDTKPSYTLIAPVASRLDANLSAGLAAKCRELAESGSENFLIDLESCTEADLSSSEALTGLHEECYIRGQSLVFTGLHAGVLQVFREQGLQEILQIAPTRIEAVDIINMEILERDLFRED